MSAFWIALGHECLRLAGRVRLRLQLAILHRRTSRAERLLGELAWQQADYDEGDSEARALQTAEQREAHLLFERGETHEQIATLSAALAEENTRAHQEIAAAESLAAASEQRALSLGKNLHVETALGSPDFVLQRIRKSLDAEEATLHELRLAVQNLKRLAEENRQKSTTVLSQLRVSLKRLELERSQLQQKKGGHYLSIGRELADAEIAPLNQPATLANVLDLREKKIRLRAAAEASLQTSQAISAAARIAARLVVALFLIGGALLLWEILRFFRF